MMKYSECFYAELDEMPINIALIFSILGKVHLPDQDIWITAREYMQEHEEKVAAVRRAFIWLGLARPDKQNPFGFSATSTLGDALTNRMKRTGRQSWILMPVKDRPVQDDFIEFAIWAAACDGEKELTGEQFEFVMDALVVAGLYGGDPLVPTTRLRELVSQSLRKDYERARKALRENAKMRTVKKSSARAERAGDFNAVK
jgi:hypothetical protein